jgi:hypothetical protein
MCWLRYNATSRKVTGSSSDEVDFFSIYVIFQPHYGSRVDSVSDRNQYQESSWGGGGGKRPPASKADLTTICESIVQKMWEPRRLTTLWASKARYRDSFLAFLLRTVRYSENMNPLLSFIKWFAQMRYGTLKYVALHFTECSQYTADLCYECVGF